MGWGAVALWEGERPPTPSFPQDLCSQHLQRPRQPSLRAPLEVPWTDSHP